MPTNRTLSELESTIKERKEYLATIEKQIEQLSESANNRLFELSGQINDAEKELAKVMKRKLEIEQWTREHVI